MKFSPNGKYILAGTLDRYMVSFPYLHCLLSSVLPFPSFLQFFPPILIFSLVHAANFLPPILPPSYPPSLPPILPPSGPSSLLSFLPPILPPSYPSSLLSFLSFLHPFLYRIPYSPSLSLQYTETLGLQQSKGDSNNDLIIIVDH